MTYIEYLKAIRGEADLYLVTDHFKGLCRIMCWDIEKEEPADHRRLRNLIEAQTRKKGFRYLDENRKWRWSLGYYLPLCMYSKQSRMAMRVKWLDQLIAKEEENV